MNPTSEPLLTGDYIMAINTKEFINKVDTGLKANESYERFYYRFKVDGRITHGVLDYTTKEWDKKTRTSKAKAEILAKKSHSADTAEVAFNENSTLDKVADTYFTLACDDTEWNRARRAEYNKYVGELRTKEELDAYKTELKKHGREYFNPAYKIGKKKIKDISTMHIDAIKRGMEQKGYSKQNADGCSPRTIKKVLAQVIKPIMQYAVDADVITKVPKITLPKQAASKKSVTNATDTLGVLYNTITALYADDGFYRALFLFALYGRRLNEILTLDWGDINFLQATYTIRDENSKTIEQTYDLPPVIAEALNSIAANREGLIFVSPVTGRKLSPPKRQLARVKEVSGVESLTFHKFRHILVSAMAESGIVSSVLSASLGHANSITTERHYITQNHTKASQEANRAIAGLLS